MEEKESFVFRVVIPAIIVFVVSGALTFFNIGWRNDFVMRWWSAFAIGWAIAASTAYFAIPFAPSLTPRIVAALEKTRAAPFGTALRRVRQGAHGRLAGWRTPQV